MIAKGLDFPNVDAGGRGECRYRAAFSRFPRGRADLSTRHASGGTHRPRRTRRPRARANLQPDHPAILAAMRHDYEAFARYELPIRAEFGYPPYQELIAGVVRGESQPQSEEFAEFMTEALRTAPVAAGSRACAYSARALSAGQIAESISLPCPTVGQRFWPAEEGDSRRVDCFAAER